MIGLTDRLNRQSFQPIYHSRSAKLGGQRPPAAGELLVYVEAVADFRSSPGCFL